MPHIYDSFCMTHNIYESYSFCFELVQVKAVLVQFFMYRRGEPISNWFFRDWQLRGSDWSTNCATNLA